MPKSRYRRKGNTRRTSPSTDRRDQLRANGPWLRRMFEVDDQEARGDAGAALRLIHDMSLGPDGRAWWRPERVRRLEQLRELGDTAPSWVWGRWVLAQAAQATPGEPQRAGAVAVETRGGRSTLWGVDDTDAMCKVIDHDWVYRQLVLHEYGGLSDFLGRLAGPVLTAKAVGIASWVDVPMGGYQLVHESADRIRWRDLRSTEIVETINLGAATMLAEDECVIGRVVRSGDVRLFESAPLCVPPSLAASVAEAPAEWLDSLAEGCRGPMGALLVELVAKLHHFDVLCDLPSGVRRQLIEPPDPDLRSDHVGSGGNGREYDAALVLAAVGGDLDVVGDHGCLCGTCDPEDSRPVAPLVSAALLEPGTIDTVARMLVPSDAPGLTRLANALVAPGDEACRRLLDRLTQAA